MAAALAWASPAAAAPVIAIDVREGALASALNELARQARVELLFDRRLVRGKSARRVRGRMSPDAAFARLLAGSGVGYRLTPEGAYVLFPIAGAHPASEAERSDGAVAELLVVGRRTQNIDIRRTENDIQPYRVLGRREIDASGRSDIDELMRTRESANAVAAPLSITTAETRSSVDLRGLGPTSTLVLVDGRRMPLAPTIGLDFNQSDISGIPLGAIERIEVLTTTAGGIYGPGAIGGVVNVVLRRDYRGADLTLAGGMSSRGDAEEARIEARLGFTPNHGATDIMAVVAHRRASALRVGERDYRERAARRAFANDPDGYVEDLITTRNGVSVVSLEGELSLDAAYGGGAIGSRYTYLPIGFTGTPAEAGALLRANAGQLPTAPSDDLAGARGHLNAAPTVTSGLLNIRHRLTPDVEVFVDGLYARNRGHFRGADDPGDISIGADRAANPFGQNIRVRFPHRTGYVDNAYVYDVGRLTGGVILDLGRGWKGAADYSIGETRLRNPRREARRRTVAWAVRDGLLAPFGDWSDLVAALPAYVEPETAADDRLRNVLRYASLRASGPVRSLPGGPLTLTLAGEAGRDRIEDAEFDLLGFPIPLSSRAQRVHSGYAEIRAPVGAADAANPLLRGLELQLAARYDRIAMEAAKAVLSVTSDERFSVTHGGATFTAGARLTPTRGLLLRASFATGERPPTFRHLQALSTDLILIGGSPDPLRGGRPVGTEGPVEYLLAGSQRVGPARARSATAGAVLNPDGGRWPRLSVDYSRIEVSHEPAIYPFDPAGLLAAEAQYPERVIRAAATAEDRAAGFTVGPVVRLDFASANVGRTLVEAVDARLDWRLPDVGPGDLRLYGALTWQPTFDQRQPGVRSTDRVNLLQGPLEWRGNGGLEWASGPTTFDLNVQYFGAYHVSYATSSAEQQAALVRAQGRVRIPAQAYVDLSVARRFTLPPGLQPRGGFDARLSVLNLFDRAPPIVATSQHLGFSEYGDPRRRRVLLSLSAQF